MNYRVVTLAACLLSAGCPITALGQEEMVIDWGRAKLTKAPTNLDRRTAYTLRVTNVNDFIYTYDGNIKVTPPEDERNRAMTQASAGDPPTSACDAWKHAKEQFAPFLPEKKAGKFVSIPLARSQQNWTDFKPSYDSIKGRLSEVTRCDGSVDKVLAKMQKAELASRSTHEYLLPRSEILGPGDSVTVEVEEKYEGELTDGGDGSGRAKFTFQAGSPVFFFSLGYLATQLQNRSYDIVDAGKQLDPATKQEVATKELKIQGTGGFTPTAATLLHYKLPFPWAVGSKWGVALSAGPVFRLTSSGVGNNTGNVGFFAGVSLHLWERLWITPGWHLGEFSDLPRGITESRGLRIPDGITNVTGVNRTSWRFGVAFSFRAADFGKTQPEVKQPAGGGSTGTPTPAKPAAQPAKTDAAKPLTETAAAAKTLEEAERKVNELQLAKDQTARNVVVARKKMNDVNSDFKLADAQTKPEKQRLLNEAVEALNLAMAKDEEATKQLGEAQQELKKAEEAARGAQSPKP